MATATVKGWKEQVAASAGSPAVVKQIDAVVGVTSSDFDNSIRTYLADGLLVIGTLAIDAVPEKFKTTGATMVFTIAGLTYTKAATTALVFSGTSTINTAAAATTAHWGAFLVQISAAGTVTTKHGAYTSGTDQDYATEALAIAALPASTHWIEATDDLTPASDCTTAHFYDLPGAKTLPAAL